MGTIFIYLLVGLTLGLVIGLLIGKKSADKSIQTEKDISQQWYNDLEKKFVAYEATSISQNKTALEQLAIKELEIDTLNDRLIQASNDLLSTNNRLSTATANYLSALRTIEEKNNDIEILKTDLKELNNQYSETNKCLATANANNAAFLEKLETQKEEIKKLYEKFNTEFENIANKIIETKSERFTELNKKNMEAILDPLGNNIKEFKKRVEEVYDKESKERFSLGEKVKELADLNQTIGEEARNLTNALKGESKTQGRWGEIILESILEKSGLRKDEEYFMEYQLEDEKGKPLKSQSEDKKMRPDAVIKYPDNRNVIIDSKVSLNAFTRLIEATDTEDQKKQMLAHVTAVKNHILTLSSKGYDDYDKSLDFVMMFIPSEPAYIAAMQGDPDLWNFAYDRRILLLSPTNLITSLKLIADLWKREYQNRNALEIAERGAKLYDKFVSFVDNMEGVGDCIDKAQNKYADAYKQLTTGNDNLVLQATKLKSLGLKTKKSLNTVLVGRILDQEVQE